ncbi:uncharacterized protein VTP21DRAFT_3526 [Calcarisporiella thermophila]|uniref:uncharacterized protein n=1 Tax=Calcarisporiella thermophila TaxID=911321 RepID=UPI0037439E98
MKLYSLIISAPFFGFFAHAIPIAPLFLRTSHPSSLSSLPTKAVANIINQNGINAQLVFTKQSEADPMHIQVLVHSGLKNAQYQYHVHVKPIPSGADCAAAGGHFAPNWANGKKLGAKGLPELESGDLSGKYGNLEGNEEGINDFSIEYDDRELKFSGDYSILGRSVVIHAPDGKRIACANIVEQKQQPQSTGTTVQNVMGTPTNYWTSLFQLMSNWFNPFRLNL